MRFALSGKAAVGTFLEEECCLLGHSRGERHLRDAAPLVLLACKQDHVAFRRNPSNNQKTKALSRDVLVFECRRGAFAALLNGQARC